MEKILKIADNKDKQNFYQQNADASEKCKPILS